MNSFNLKMQCAFFCWNWHSEFGEVVINLMTRNWLTSIFCRHTFIRSTQRDLLTMIWLYTVNFTIGFASAQNGTGLHRQLKIYIFQLYVYCFQLLNCRSYKFAAIYLINWTNEQNQTLTLSFTILFKLFCTLTFIASILNFNSKI